MFDCCSNDSTCYQRDRFTCCFSAISQGDMQALYHPWSHVIFPPPSTRFNCWTKDAPTALLVGPSFTTHSRVQDSKVVVASPLPPEELSVTRIHL